MIRSLQPLIDLNDPVESGALIDAKSDLEAIKQWITRFDNTHTKRAYERDARRFLLWICYVKGAHLNDLTMQDIQSYVEFLQNPGDAWCMKSKKLKRLDVRWRPFSKPLSKRSTMAAISVLQSLFSFLEIAGYINKNPVKLIKTSNIIGNIQAQKYNVYTRMLEQDEWIAVQEALQELPSETQDDKKYKARANLLFSMLYILGLRIEEAATSVWLNFCKIDGRFWFFIQGKGGKLGQVPVNESLLQVLTNYRQIYQISSDIEHDDNFIFKSETGANYSSRTLYNIVKNIGALSALKFKDKTKIDKLRRLSPHWLRHLSASHQDKRGMSLTMIRDNHRHASINTTQIYMHSEDVARHAMMQVQHIEVQAVEPNNALEYYLSIKLAKGPLDKEKAISLINKSIEATILKGAQLLQGDFSSLKYKICNPLSSLDIDRIKMLCKIWMFDPTIEQGGYA